VDLTNKAGNINGSSILESGVKITFICHRIILNIKKYLKFNVLAVRFVNILRGETSKEE
jgi:hypothetical protein